MKLLLFLLLTFSLTATAQSQQGDSAFARKDYMEAVRCYEAVAQKSPSADVFYNLGNAYYRLNNYPKAVLCLRRALRYDPSHKDAAFNLALTESKLDDRFDPPSRMFFITLMERLVSSHGATYWGVLAIGALFFSLVLFGIYFLTSKVWLRKVGFFAGLMGLLAVIAFNVFAYIQQDRFENERRVVIMEQEVKLYDSPASGSKTLRTLHGGTTLLVVDTYGKDWLQVELPDGKIGWLLVQGTENV